MSKLYFFLLIWASVHFSAELKVGDNKLPDALQTDGSFKIPHVMQRLYQKWSSKPKYNAKMIQSVPVKVEKQKDGDLLLTFPIPQTGNTTIRKVNLLIEVHDAEMKKFYQPYYGVDIRLLSDTFQSFIHANKKPQIHDTYLELYFNITRLYMLCRDADAPTIQLKLQFSRQSSKTTPEETLKTENINAFIILQEVAQEDRHTLMDATFPVTSLDTTPEPNKSIHPLQDVFYPRSKRMVVPRRQSKRPCVVTRWYVKFSEMGWNWIVHPVGYGAYRCVGRCYFPLTDSMNTTNHAVVQTLMHSINGKPRAASCVPNELSPLTIIFKDGDKKILTLRKYADMIVKSCACL